VHWIFRNPLIAMVLGPTVWALHFVLIYALLSIGCALDWQAVDVAGLDAVRIVLLAVTAAAAVPLLWLAWRAWRGTADEMDGLRSRAVVALALLSLLAVLWEAMAIPLMQPCL
jgi:cation transport ATPase